MNGGSSPTLLLCCWLYQATTAFEKALKDTISGRTETIEVAHKGRTADPWCENASTLIASRWRYMNLTQSEQ